MRACLVCDGPAAGDWCGKRCRAALRALGRALVPDARSREAIAAGVAHRRITAEMGVGFPWELVG